MQGRIAIVDGGVDIGAVANELRNPHPSTIKRRPVQGCVPLRPVSICNRAVVNAAGNTYNVAGLGGIR
jgi:hypothetical protein